MAYEMPIDPDELYDYVLERYDKVKGIGLADSDAIVDSAMQEVFDYLSSCGILGERLDDDPGSNPFRKGAFASRRATVYRQS